MASKHYYRVLYNLILKKQKEAEFQAKSDKKDRKKKRSQVDKVTIAVMKYQPIDFSKLVEFIHCGSVEINSFSVAGKLSIYFYPAKTAFTDQYSLPNIFFDIGQL
jgi:hypothetical protein